MSAVTELDDIQALVRTGFGSLRGAAYVLLRIRDAAAAREWLASILPAAVADLAGEPLTEALQIALTAPGLVTLGTDTTGFAPEFRQGMAEPSRARRLGDVGANAPEHWAWGHGDRQPHLLVMLFCEKPVFAERLDALHAATATGFELLAVLDTGDMAGREPFGFMDGVSQPSLDWQGVEEPGATPSEYSNVMTAGEVLLGYPNEYGHVSDHAADLGRNGSYLVMRRLDQDVHGFWRWVGEHGGTPLAEAMVGRRLDGAPLGGLTARPIAGETDPRNAFTYDNDASGHICPHGGHIRRSNPRTADHPTAPSGWLQRLASTLGFRGSVQDDAIAATRFHRILRRGREFGDWLAPEDAARDDAPATNSGLNFICLQASIARQFEFVQGAWLMSAKFGGLSDEADPLLGNRLDHPPGSPTAAFTRQKAEQPAERFERVPQFVTVSGGAYFFLPGLRALRLIAKS